MYECVNPMHPDKVADRIGGAILDLAYKKCDNPIVAGEMTLGHGVCFIVLETNVAFKKKEIKEIVNRITGHRPKLILKIVPQDAILARNQKEEVRCGDNGIFVGNRVLKEERVLKNLANEIYKHYKTDGKYIIDGHKFIICQSHCEVNDDWISNLIKTKYDKDAEIIINPLGYWTGSEEVDTGSVNRKLGSDMGRNVTGGGLHCLDGDSEYLGEDLIWHKMSDYTGGKIAQWNSGNCEFETPLKYIKTNCDEFIHIYNSTKLDMCLTPNHDMLILTSKNNLIKRKANEIAKKLEQEIGNSGRIVHNFIYPHTSEASIYQDSAEYRLQVAFCADGTILNQQGDAGWNGRIRVKKEYKKKRLRELLVGKHYKETKDGDYSIFWYHFTKASKSLRECFENEDWEILKEEIFKWDGNERLKIFRTTKKDEADFIQLVLASFGLVATIVKENMIGTKRVVSSKTYIQNSNLYCVSVKKSKTTYLRKTKETPINVQRTRGNFTAYCFEVPSHNLIIRRNNRIFITGNCKDITKADVSVNIYAFLKAQKWKKRIELDCAIGDTKIDGKPYSEIVKIAKEYIDSIGGFEKFAEWGLIRPTNIDDEIL